MNEWRYRILQIRLQYEVRSYLRSIEKRARKERRSAARSFELALDRRI